MSKFIKITTNGVAFLYIPLASTEVIAQLGAVVPVKNAWRDSKYNEEVSDEPLGLAIVDGLPKPAPEPIEKALEEAASAKRSWLQQYTENQTLKAKLKEAEDKLAAISAATAKV